MANLTLVAGDTAPTRLIYRDGKSGQPIDIAGYSITMNIGYDTPLTKQATLVADVTGAFDFEWLTTDLVAGQPQAEIIVEDADGKIRTHKIGTIVVQARLAP